MSRNTPSLAACLSDIKQLLKPAGDAAVVDGGRHTSRYETKRWLRHIQQIGLNRILTTLHYQFIYIT